MQQHAQNKGRAALFPVTAIGGRGPQVLLTHGRNQGHGVIDEGGGVWIQDVQGIETRRRQPGDPHRVYDRNVLAQFLAVACCYDGILTFWINHNHRPEKAEKGRDNAASSLARPRGRYGHEMPLLLHQNGLESIGRGGVPAQLEANRLPRRVLLQRPSDQQTFLGNLLRQLDRAFEGDHGHRSVPLV